MNPLLRDRMAADAPDGTVVFLIGMRVNAWWKPWKYLPVARAMVRMLAELAAQPALGLLHSRGHFSLRSPFLVQYWQSAEHLLAYANRRDLAHRPAWTDFYRRVGSGGDVGIWHETYVLPAGAAEAIYVAMPRFGLGAAVPLHKATGHRDTAAGRLSTAVKST